ncbi:MAG TPA: hypothetical protein VHJ76_06000 [Actinomycetota bacterium]|nr:hypothetical protein [Actinomycetota bacterium]
MKTLRVVALATALMMVAAACGGEDGGDEPDTGAAAQETAAESNDAFCESVVAAETAVLAASSGGDPSGVEDLVATVEETAPQELEEQVTVVVTAVRRALETRDDSAFETEEFTQNEEEVDRWVADNCGFDAQVDVTAVDYAFEGVPETLPAGIATFNFSNEGTELHEMLMVRYKDPSTTVEDLMKLSDREAQKVIDFIGASFGPPGASDTESKELTPGKYALLCFVPVGATSEKAAEKADGPPHVARGMSAEFTVE